MNKLHQNLAMVGLITASIIAVNIKTSAQTTLFSNPTPLSDTNCNFANNPECYIYETGGTRSVTTVSETRVPFNTFFDRVTGEYRVNFQGSLFIEGLAFDTNTRQFFPSVDASSVTFPSVDVELTSQYTGYLDGAIGLKRDFFDGSPGYFQRFSDFQTTVSRIDVEISPRIYNDRATGVRYDYSLRAVDPTVITQGDRTALSGTYRAEAPAGAISFGRISGNAIVVSNPEPSRVEASSNLAFISPFALRYDTAVEETTKLDQDGLVTPKVSVSQGVDMNGSKVTELADGTAPTDAVNKRQLDAEAAARIASDTALAGQITDEQAARTQADLQLRQRIDTSDARVDLLSTAFLNEANARANADLAMSSRIDTLGTRLDAVEGRLDILDDKISSSTAVAVAMSGATFLPDTKFNLTANVATYGGAQAGSIQMGALITRNVAVNAGVASGFNRRGKTAGRVGFTLGW